MFDWPLFSVVGDNGTDSGSEYDLKYEVLTIFVL